jgi:hypothetical protein
MIAPGDHAYSELISEHPAISSLSISMAAGARPPALWSNICGASWILACCLPPIGLSYVVHCHLPYMAHRIDRSFPTF